MTQTTESMQEKLVTYRKAANRAIDYQMSFQLPDGGYIWDGYAVDAYHKQAYSWSLGGHFAEANKLLDWIKANTLQADGQLKDYNGDLYKHAWLFQGAHRMGRFDISYPVMSFLKSCQFPCGGFPHFAADDIIRAISTGWTGVSALYFGDLETAQKAADCCINMLRQQPDESRYYFQMTRDGKLLTEKENPEAGFIDTTKLKQCYWEVGFSMLLMCRMYQATGEQSYLDHAGELFEFKLRCREDNYAYWGSGKSALASAVYYMLTGDERARDAAYRFCDFVVETQRPEGGFQYEDEPDELLIYVDHAACFSVWTLESLTAMESKQS